jgi:cullin-associated NEDD8-dissociated protein 1
LAQFLRRCKAERGAEIVKDVVSRLVKEGKDQQHDVGSLGMKTVIQDTPPGRNESSIICDTAIPEIVSFLHKGASSTSTENECLDILTTLAGKYTSALAHHHQSMKEAVFAELDGNKAGIRKRAMHCLAAMAPHMSEQLFHGACDALAKGLESSGGSTDSPRTYLQATAFVTRSAGFRFGPYIGTFLPTIIEHCRAVEEDDELKEYVLYSIEACVLRCPRETRRFFNDMVSLSMECLTYDPNYADDDEDNEADDMDLDGEDVERDEEDMEDDDVGSDDDDESWKVRRAAAKCCSALIAQYSDSLPALYTSMAPLLVKRFNEREESVKIEVIDTLQMLLRKTTPPTVSIPQAESDTKEALKGLEKLKQKLLKVSIKQMKHNSLRIRGAVFRMLKHLLHCEYGALEGYLTSIAQSVRKTLKDKNASSSLRIEVLDFVNSLLQTHSSASLDSCLSDISHSTFSATSDKYFKVSAISLKTCETMVNVIRPSVGSEPSSSAHQLVQPLYDNVSEKLNMHDQDQEVKEAAIMCMGNIAARLGDMLSDKLESCFSVLLERLRNDTTRLASVRAFEIISSSQLKLNSLESTLKPVAQELAGFLRKAMRALRASSLSTLEAIVRNHGDQLDKETVTQIVKEACELVIASDFSLASAAITLCIEMLEQRCDVADTVARCVVPGTHRLLSTGILQESTVQVLNHFYAKLSMTDARDADFNTMLDQLIVVGKEAESSKQHLHHCVGRCISGMCTAHGQQKAIETAKALLERFSGLEQKSGENSSSLLLVVIGELGKDNDLAEVSGLLSTLKSAMDLDEDVRSASAFALGCVAVGSTKNFLPTIMQAIENGEQNKYALMGALRKVIAQATRLDDSEMTQVRDILMRDMNTEDDHLRGVVAECTGRLAVKAPSFVVSSLASGCSNTSDANVRSCTVTALRFALQDAQISGLDEHLDQNIESYLSLMEDDNRYVRHAAVQTFSAVLHYKPQIIVDKLERLLPKLYGQATLKPELVREVNLGPFTHKVDEGLDTRKAAYGCMDRLVQRVPGHIEPNAFLERLGAGLQDESDVRQTCHIILQRLPSAEAFRQPLLGRLDGLMEPLRKTIFARLKNDAVKQEVDRHDDLVRSGMRAIASLERMPGSDGCVQFKELLDAIKQSDQKERFLSIRSELDSPASASAITSGGSA